MVAAWFWASEASRPSSRLLTVAPWLWRRASGGATPRGRHRPWQRAAGEVLSARWRRSVCWPDYLAALPFLVAAGIPGTRAFNPSEPLVFAVYLAELALLLLCLRGG